MFDCAAGIFLYPADKKSPKGKLRMLYEGYPMALITEQAGGVASTGMFNGSVQRILDVPPEGIHDRCPIVMVRPHVTCTALAALLCAAYPQRISLAQAPASMLR